jgi:hypothetical protein
VREKKPANDAANNVTSGKRNVDVERLDLREACGLEEDD